MNLQTEFETNFECKFEFESQWKAMASYLTAALLLVAALVGSAAPATAATGASVPDQKCARSQSDPHEMASRISPNAVSLQGACVDTTLFRPVVDLQMSDDGQKVTFYNYLYHDGFWKAEVSLQPGAIDAVLFEIKHFPTVKYVEAAHTEMRFRMNAKYPILLTNQLTGEQAHATDIMMSYEAALTVNKPLNILLAALPVYPFVGRAGEAATIQSEKPRPLQQYELSLEPDERVSLLLSELKRSQEIGLNTFYNTLRPNCTTEQFDFLDALPRLKGKARKFVVAFSNDPVAGPSIEALKERGLIKARLQNFEDEVAGRTSELPFPENTTHQNDTLPFIPAPDNAPWSLVLMSPDPNSLSFQDRAAIELLKVQLVMSALKVYNTYSAVSAMNGSDVNSRANLFLSALKAAEKELLGSMHDFDHRLSPTIHMVGAYLLPMTDDGASKITLQKWGIEVSVPFPVYEVNIDLREGNNAQTFAKMLAGLGLAADQGAKNPVPAYLMSTSLVMKLKHDASTLNVQTMIGLNSQEKPFSKVNSQVAIDRVFVPSGKNEKRPVALLTSHQVLSEDFNPEVSISFGMNGGFNQIFYRGEPGVQQLLTYSPDDPAVAAQACQERSASVPTLAGKLGTAPSGVSFIDLLLKGHPVNFEIYSMNFNLESLSINDLDVHTDLAPLKCLNIDSIKTQFQSQANDALTGLKTQVMQNGEALQAVLSSLFGV